MTVARVWHTGKGRVYLACGAWYVPLSPASLTPGWLLTFEPLLKTFLRFRSYAFSYIFFPDKSRARKIKCDGARPICTTCVRRKSTKCVYDEVPKRRGPDRRPRQRPNQPGGTHNAPPSAPRPAGVLASRASGSGPTSVSTSGGGGGVGTTQVQGGSTSVTPVRKSSSNVNVVMSQDQQLSVPTHPHPPSTGIGSLFQGSDGSSIHPLHQHPQGVHSFPRFEYQGPLNTPAPNVPLVSSFYSAGAHQSHHLRAPPKVFHRGLSPSPSNSVQYNVGDSMSHLPPLTVTAAANVPSPSSHGLSYILNPTANEEDGSTNPNMHPNASDVNHLGVRPCQLSSPPASIVPNRPVIHILSIFRISPEPAPVLGGTMYRS